MKKFEADVGGEEEANNVLLGKSDWRYNKWAWIEYVDIVNSAKITEGHLNRLRLKILEQKDEIRQITESQLIRSMDAVGAAPWKHGAPQPRDKVLAIRRELIRALGEWVLIVQEVKAYNDRQTSTKTSKYNLQVSRIEQEEQAMRRRAEQRNTKVSQAISQHNINVRRLQDMDIDVEIERINNALEILHQHEVVELPSKMDLARSKIIPGTGRPQQQTISAECLHSLERIAAGQSLTLVMRDAKRRSVKRRSSSAPPRSSPRGFEPRFELLHTASVQRGRSSRVRHGGGGRAPRPKKDGKKGKQQKGKPGESVVAVAPQGVPSVHPQPP